jgi:hypothetical protein
MPERRAVAAAFVAAFLVVALAVPVIGLFRDRPAPFSWHMYSALASLPDVSVIDASGAERAVNLETILAAGRAEVDYVAALVERLCQADGVAGIRIAHEDVAEVRSCD